MITTIALWLISKRPSLTLSYAQRLVKIGLVAVVAIVATVAFLVWLDGQKDAAVDDYKQEVEARAAPAREEAANERAADTIRNTTSEKELHDAIEAAPSGGELSPAARALACERLRKLGRIPAACGREGDN